MIVKTEKLPDLQHRDYYGSKSSVRVNQDQKTIEVQKL